jgi:hypothetical protein
MHVAEGRVNLVRRQSMQIWGERLPAGPGAGLA